MQTVHDPAISSYYVNDELYRNLVENFSDWQREELAIAAPEVRDRFRLLLEREALSEIAGVPHEAIAFVHEHDRGRFGVRRR